MVNTKHKKQNTKRRKSGGTRKYIKKNNNKTKLVRKTPKFGAESIKRKLGADFDAESYKRKLGPEFDAENKDIDSNLTELMKHLKNLKIK